MATPRAFFQENLNLFTNPQGTPEQQEKYNLYGGLMALARQIEDIELKVRNIEQAVSYFRLNR